MTASVVSSREQRKSVLQKRIRLIVAFTIGYNLIEAIVAIAAGTAASSGALIGFGLDSTIEVLSAAAVAWQFTRKDPERWEKGTLRVIAVAFFALALYVGASSVLALTGVVEAEHSTVGIVLTALSVVIMPFLSLAERRTGKELGSATAIADSKRCEHGSALPGVVDGGVQRMHRHQAGDDSEQCHESHEQLGWTEEAIVRSRMHIVPHARSRPFW